MRQSITHIGDLGVRTHVEKHLTDLGLLFGEIW